MIYSNTLSFFLSLRALKCIFMLPLSFFTVVCLTIDGVCSPYWLSMHQGNTLSDAECFHFKQQLLMAWCRGTIAVSAFLIRAMMWIGSASLNSSWLSSVTSDYLLEEFGSSVKLYLMWPPSTLAGRKITHRSPAASGNGAFWRGGGGNMLVLFSIAVIKWICDQGRSSHTYVFHTQTKHMYKRH